MGFEAKDFGFSTRAIHEGYEPSGSYGSLSPPIYMTSTFAFESSEQAEATFAGEHERYVYGRTHNPTQAILEKRLASLEGAEAALVAASGMGAISSVLWTLLSAGDELVAHKRMYGNSFTLIREALPKFGIKVTLVDMLDLRELAQSLTQRTKLVFLECPANPLLEVAELADISRMAGALGARVVVDSTLASPYLLRPLEYGAHLVVHSATKYLSGHGDVLGGVVAGDRATITQVRKKGLRYMTGATLSPLAAFLIQRGVKTLSLRMDKHCENALELANFLSSHPKVRRVHYPGLQDHDAPPGTCSRLLLKGGGMLSFDLLGGVTAARTFLNSVHLARIGVSLGDPETLVQHPATMTHSAYAESGLEAYGLSHDTVRVSVGLEETRDIIGDFEQALHRVF